MGDYVSTKKAFALTDSQQKRVGAAVLDFEHRTPAPANQTSSDSTATPRFWVTLGDEDPSNHGRYKFTKKVASSYALTGATPTFATTTYLAQEVNSVRGLSGRSVEVEFAGYDASHNPVYIFESFKPTDPAACTTSSPATLGSSSEGSETALTTTWAGSGPLDLWMTSRVVYNHTGDKKIYGFARKLSFDSCGKLVAVTGETRYEVDAAGSCT